MFRRTSFKLVTTSLTVKVVITSLPRKRGEGGDGVSSAMTNQPAGKATRRRRGEPRRLLLDAARELFARQGFTNTNACDVAELAGVSEPLLYRHFGSKVSLFREALVVPFLELVRDFEDKWQSGTLAALDDEDVARQFLGDLFDRLQMGRGLVLTLWGSEAESTGDLVDSGVCEEISQGLRTLVDISTAEAAPRTGPTISDHEVSDRAAVAMIAGVAVFGQSVFLGRQVPSRDQLVEELVQTILHGRLHRGA
jgi:AcrR family transcriptional regulator